MLTLSRKGFERIWIGDDVQVQLVRIINRNNALIGVEAPKEIPILRGEIYSAPDGIKVGSILWSELWERSRNVSFRASFPHSVTHLHEGDRIVGVVLTIEEFKRLTDNGD